MCIRDSGGALGVSVGNHIHMLGYSWYSVISPEGAASVSYTHLRAHETFGTISFCGVCV
ncbi:hypothetical protein [Bacillus pumilus]|uniref:hypothetical protein n=1 Tax=Bacillus pumilus TaxID=1408 RepID=UPI0037039782